MGARDALRYHTVAMGNDDKPDLRLNELERFRKTSSRLALEAHSHCEVPAGCGGVVLRWTRPGAPLGR